jgi:hypothetical protein
MSKNSRLSKFRWISIDRYRGSPGSRHEDPSIVQDRTKQRGIVNFSKNTKIKNNERKIFLYFFILRKEPIEMATKVNQEPLEPWTRESNQVAIAHLHTTLNKSRDEKLEVFRMNFTYYPGSVIT